MMVKKCMKLETKTFKNIINIYIERDLLKKKTPPKQTKLSRTSRSKWDTMLAKWIPEF